MTYSNAMMRKTARQTGFQSVSRKEDGNCIPNFEGVKLKLEKSLLLLKLELS